MLLLLGVASLLVIVGLLQSISLLEIDEIASDIVYTPREFVPVNKLTGSIVQTNMTGSILHSSHFCHSVDQASGNSRRGSCRFKNLCAISDKNAREGLRWLYISPRPDLKIEFSLGTGPHIVDDRVLVTPEIIGAQAFEKEFPKYQTFESKAALFHEYNGENFGHVLTDVLMPLYFLQRSFADEADRNITLFEFSPRRPMGNNCKWMLRKKEWKTRATQHCGPLRKQLFPTFSLNEVLPFDENATLVQNMPFCFKDVELGTGMLSDDCLEGTHGRKPSKYSLCNHGKQAVFWEFRKFLIEGLGVKDNIPNRPVITIWNGNPKRRVTGLEACVEAIRAELPQVHVQIVSLETMSFAEQVKVMVNTTVHVTTPGGGSFVSIFLPRGATAIRLFSMEYLLEHHFFPYLGYIHVEHVDVTANRHVVEPTILLPLVQDALNRFELFKK